MFQRFRSGDSNFAVRLHGNRRVQGHSASSDRELPNSAGRIGVAVRILEGVLVGLLVQNEGVADREFKLLQGKQRKSFPDEASLPDLLSLARNENLKPGLGALLGEVHGVAENPQLMRALLETFGIGTIALEWHQELETVVDTALTGRPLTPTA